MRSEIFNNQSQEIRRFNNKSDKMTMEMLMKLLDIKMMARSRLGFRINFMMRSEERDFSVSSSANLRLSIEKKATSEPLTRPEHMIKRTSIKTSPGREVIPNNEMPKKPKNKLQCSMSGSKIEFFVNK